MNTEKLSAHNELFRALADPTRRRMLPLLLRGEWCVADLVATLGVSQPKASRHLAYLKRSGLVVARRDANWTHYSLAPAKSAVHQKLLECLVCCVEQE